MIVCHHLHLNNKKAQKVYDIILNSALESNFKLIISTSFPGAAKTQKGLCYHIKSECSTNAHDQTSQSEHRNLEHK